MISTVFVIYATTSVLAMEEGCGGCGYPGLPPNAHFVGIDPNMDQEFDTGFVVTYECEDLFQLTGEPNRICECSGRWSGSLPQCVGEVYDPKDKLDLGYYVFDSNSLSSGLQHLIRMFHPCKKPDLPQYSIVSLIRDKNGTVYLILQCREGYYLNGESLKTCGEDGTWSTIQSECIWSGNDFWVPVSSHVNSVDSSSNHSSWVSNSTDPLANSSTNLPASNSSYFPTQLPVLDVGERDEPARDNVLTSTYDSAKGAASRGSTRSSSYFTNKTSSNHLASTVPLVYETTRILQQNEIGIESVKNYTDILHAWKSKETMTTAINIVCISLALGVIIGGILTYTYIRRRRRRRKAKTANRRTNTEILTYYYEEQIPMQPTPHSAILRTDDSHVYESIGEDLDVVATAAAAKEVPDQIDTSRA